MGFVDTLMNVWKKGNGMYRQKQSKGTKRKWVTKQKATRPCG